MRYLIFLLLLCSCATSKKYAIQLSEKGLHEAALPKWIEAYKNDPDDVEVQIGLKISQETVVNERLVKIRDLRASNDYPNAMAALKELIDVQNQWGIKLDFNSSTFQGNEVKALWTYQKETINRLVTEGKPLAAEHENRRYSSMFASMNDVSTIKDKISDEGAKQCLKLQKDLSQKPFYTSFVTQFCKFFNPGREISSVNASISSALFAQTNIAIQIKGINPDMSSTLSNSINKSFSGSPWYNPDSKKVINVNISGQYVWEPKSKYIHQAHNYTVSIPYTAYEATMKTRQVPYQATEYQCVYNYQYGNSCGNVYVTRYRTDFYWENEPVTRYREEARVYEYQATKNSQDLILVLKGSITIGNLKIPFSYSKHESEEKIVHDFNLPEIGLSPAREDVSSPIEKFKEYSEYASADFQKDLNTVWIKNYCTLPKTRNIASVAENVIRCKKASDFPEEFVDKWFNNTFGVSSLEAENIIGGF